MKYDSNPDWYRAKHALAREYVNWAKGKKDARAIPLLDQAERCVSELLRQAETTVARPIWGRGKKAAVTKTLKKFITDDVIPTARVLLVEIEAARQAREAGAETEVATATVRDISKESSANPDVSYGLARFYAQIEERKQARESLQLVVAGTSRPAWPGLAHKFVRDPVLIEVLTQPGFLPAEGFGPYLQTALAAAQGSRSEPEGLD